jgi:hypothetical protein
MTAPVRPTDGSCSRWLGSAYCRARETRYFAVGHRCPDHSPCALAGQPELPPGPGIPAYQRESGAAA